MPDRYISLGLSLISFGIVLASFSYFILLNTPLTALGIACVILGFTAASLPEHVVPRNAVKAMLRGAVLNIEALLEEFEVHEKAIYLAPKDGLVTAFIPLKNNPKQASVDQIYKAPRRVVTQAGGEPGLIIFPPGAEIVRASEIAEASLEQAIQYILVEVTELCSSASVVENADSIVVDMKKVKVNTEAERYSSSMGSIATSIAACIIAYVRKKAISLVSEEHYDSSITAKFSYE
ncbi:MAG: hypothetical protein QXV84_04570 [Conexivisphaerales archaeon]